MLKFNQNVLYRPGSIPPKFGKVDNRWTNLGTRLIRLYVTMTPPDSDYPAVGDLVFITSYYAKVSRSLIGTYYKPTIHEALVR